ncbi:MAG: 4'-phosphopantetheinyl transferase superfamily protein [Omnitrophica bacterium]|nr:4'-phosphopantetheinyl transferase superfamily protein [Candidatus Omnitrophota bacterium]
MVGIDIVEIRQIRNIYLKHGLLFLEKVLAAEEINELPQEKNKCFFRNLSCLLASKEAIFKAYGRADLDWQDISLRNITKMPLIYIKKTDFSKKIKLSFAIDRDIVISQALIV